MPRKKKQDIKINNNPSLEGLMQETYNDACSQITHAQTSINELSTGTEPGDVDDATKITKEKGGLLKIKDSAIRIKLEIAKLQNDIIKSTGDASDSGSSRGGGSVDLTAGFDNIREMIKAKAAEASKEVEEGENNEPKED